MLLNIKTYENGWSLENLRVVAIKLLESTEFASPNPSIYFIISYMVFGSVVIEGDFPCTLHL